MEKSIGNDPEQYGSIHNQKSGKKWLGEEEIEDFFVHHPVLHKNDEKKKKKRPGDLNTHQLLEECQSLYYLFVLFRAWASSRIKYCHLIRLKYLKSVITSW
jgi:hypothetical protein